MKESFRKRYKNREQFIWMLRIKRWIKEDSVALEKAIERIFGGANNGEHTN